MLYTSNCINSLATRIGDDIERDFLIGLLTELCGDKNPMWKRWKAPELGTDIELKNVCYLSGDPTSVPSNVLLGGISTSFPPITSDD